jgi:hypothetical protein
MAWPGHRMAAPQDPGRLRAAHADREHVVATLKAAYVYGLVTKDEFDARVGQTFAARTFAELAVITADIPAGLALPPPPSPALAAASPPVGANLGPGRRAVVATAALAGLLFFAALCAGDSIIPQLLAGATGSALVSLLFAGAQMARSRRDPVSGGQSPPRRPVQSGPRACRGAASAAPAELPATGKGRRPGSTEAASRHSLRPQVSS